MRTAVVWGITGQDGSYLAELLLSKSYRVIGVSRRVSVPRDERIRHLYQNPNFQVVAGDVTDPHSVHRVLSFGFSFCGAKYDPPMEIYNLAAQSHVQVSFDEPTHTTGVTYLGCLNILEAIHNSLELVRRSRFYQASSSEMFGSAFSRLVEYSHGAALVHSEVGEKATGDWCYQCEETPMRPNSPYAIAKLAAHHAVRMYREAYGVHASSGILFNHESERRGEAFVTRKITKYVARYRQAKSTGEAIEPLHLGNIQAKRDWGHAADYVRAMWLMLQQDEADDYVVCTGQTHTVEDFLLKAFAVAGFSADKVADLPVIIDESLFRPSEVPFLRGNASKAKAKPGWEPTIDFDELVRRMVYADVGGSS